MTTVNDDNPRAEPIPTASPQAGSTEPVLTETAESPATQQPATTTTVSAIAAAVETHDSAPETDAHPRETLVDPKIAALRAMFPDFDDLLLQSVLDSVGGNQDRAIDVLLGMTDPEYQSDARPEMSQTELDEQLARRLYLEDEQQQAAWQASQQQTRQHPGWQQQAPHRRPVEEKDTMAEIGDQINKFAETGKKTLGNFFSKVKTKIQELDQGREGSTSHGVGGDTYPYDNGHQNPFPTPHSAPYFDPNSQPTSTSNLGPNTQTRGYDATPSPSIELGPAPAPVTPPVPIDTGKIGLLPKRPVSLLRTQSPPLDTSSSRDAEEDDLEYVENPFENPKK
ncbi:hypothetical protein C8J56DRAFT_438239 [Mycena floridula]|nr:hypothetical protein C8J56DRAFT_438239 [Mycena floridula]